MINALRRFYNSFGDRGVMMVIFTVSVIVHSLLTMHMELPAVNPDEIGVASVAAFYSGRDWSALMGQVYYYYGYVQAIFYAPLFLFFSNSYALVEDFTRSSSIYESKEALAIARSIELTR